MKNIYALSVLWLVALPMFIIDIHGEKDGSGQFGKIDKFLTKIAIIAPIITSVATMIFVIMLRTQIKNQNKEHELTLRPIIIIDKRPNKAMEITKDMKNIVIRLANIGNIPTGKTRVMLLPLEDHDGFQAREIALKKYLKYIGRDKLRNTDSCIMMRPIRERAKKISESRSLVNYLILGDDFKKLEPTINKFDDVVKKFGSGEKRRNFGAAGQERAKSMAKLSLEDWDKFYLAGGKHGDLLDKAGPVDWEMFEGETGEKGMRKILGKYADMVYATAPDRKRILEEMNKKDREQYDEALKKRLEAWEKFQHNIIEEFAKTSMDMRVTYGGVKDVTSIMHNMLAPDHPVELMIPLDKKDIESIESGEWMYFGVVVQYSRPGGNLTEYTYSMQGYIEDKKPVVERTQEELD